MLNEAQAAHPDIEFIHGDIANFAPTEKIDCLFANASLQWLAHHETLLPSLLKRIHPGGIFAMQMPNNFHAPTHQVTIQLLQDHAEWQPYLQTLHYGRLTKPLYQLPWYYDLLTRAGSHELQCWGTEYLQEMADYQAIFAWVSGTGLRPVLTAMNTDHQTRFTNAYVNAIREAYPLQANGKVLMPFNRIFITALC